LNIAELLRCECVIFRSEMSVDSFH